MKLSVLLLVLLLIGCSGGVEQAASRPTQTVVPATQRQAVAATPTGAQPTSRSLTATPAVTTTPAATPTASPTPPPPSLGLWQYPIRLAGRAPGDGFVIRHGYAVENTWFNPGDWHTGEDWYAQAGETCIRTKSWKLKNKVGY